MDILDKEIEHYIQQNATPESDLLKKLNRDTWANVLMPRMLSGHVQGRVLSMIAHMIRPQRILEIGTFTGYSALCLAEGLTPDGLLYTIDVNEELEDMVRKFIEMSGLQERIRLLIGDATQLIPSMNEMFDLVFIDADKANYSNYYHLVFEKIRPGGFILADNVLWSGKVAEHSKKDKDTQNLLAFNELIKEDPRVENVILPVRDGIMLIRKK